MSVQKVNSTATEFISQYLKKELYYENFSACIRQLLLSFSNLHRLSRMCFFMLGNMYFLMMKNVFLMRGKESIFEVLENFCCSQKLNPSQQNLQSTAFNCSWNSIEQQTLIQREGGIIFNNDEVICINDKIPLSSEYASH